MPLKYMVADTTMNPICFVLHILTNFCEWLVLKRCIFEINGNPPSRVIQRFNFNSIAMFPIAIALRVKPFL